MSVDQLGYLAVEAADPEAWERFATEVLGFTVGERLEGGGFTLRLDGNARRLFITPGPADDVSAVGWQVADAELLTALVARLTGLGVAVEEADPEPRRVAARFCLRDPGGVPVELFCGPELAEAPFASPLVPGGFVADEQGLGHVVVSAKDKQESVRFYREGLGFALSDHIVCEIHGYPVDLDFFHVPSAGGVPRRHHSVAVGGRMAKNIHHVMFEARDMDEVGLAFDRLLKSGGRVQQTPGRHPNDRMFSFYADTPSGFQFEFGWGGRLVDDADWTPTTYDHISEWGHLHPSVFWPRKKKQ